MGPRNGSRTEQLREWLAPFLAVLGARRPTPVSSALHPGTARPCMEPLVLRVAPADVQQLHHFALAAPWPI
jgi:hypothetical protein